MEDFLLTTFPITNPFFAGTLERLLDAARRCFPGPLFSVKLPFVPAGTGRGNFPEVLPESFPPYRHQQQAWERLDTRAGPSTIVATGTGSGKTECFLYPDPRPLLPAARRRGNQGHPHLPDERAGHRPGATAREADLAESRTARLRHRGALHRRGSDAQARRR